MVLEVEPLGYVLLLVNRQVGMLIEETIVHLTCKINSYILYRLHYYIDYNSLVAI